jgi:uncharacterized protein
VTVSVGVNSPSLLTAVTYGAVLLAVLGLWLGRRVWMAALVLAIVLGYAARVLSGPAVIWIGAFAGLCIGYERAKTLDSAGPRIAFTVLAAIGILVVGVLLGMHALPGFQNYRVLENVVLSSGAEPYSLYLNFDKTLVGLCILRICYRGLLVRAEQWRQALRRALPIAAVNVVVVALGAMALGYLTWQPKWTALFWLWAPVNLFFTCLSEEAFFRGFIQRELASGLRNVRAGGATAIFVSAVLFGLAHFGGGVSYVVLATAAGLGYAIIYHRTQSIEMSMLAHFALNATHFVLFTYPRAL